MSLEEARRFFVALTADKKLFARWGSELQRAVNLAHEIGFGPTRPVLWGARNVSDFVAASGFTCTGQELDKVASEIEAERGSELFPILPYGIVVEGDAWKAYRNAWAPPPESAAIVRYRRDHVKINSPTCGELVDVLAGESVSPTIALASNIRTTVPHFHGQFEEVYFMLEGTIGLRLFDYRARCGATSFDTGPRQTLSRACGAACWTNTSANTDSSVALTTSSESRGRATRSSAMPAANDTFWHPLASIRW